MTSHQLGFAGVVEPPLRLDVTLEPGLHTVWGEPAAGTERLILLASGALAPRRGKVTLAGASPHRSPSSRRTIASLWPVESLLPGSSVEQSLALALELREAKQTPREVLEPARLVHWLARRCEHLDDHERRGIALALALSHSAPRLVALFEPLSRVAGLSRQWVLDRICELAAAGAIVLVTSASRSDARALGGGQLALQRGRLSPNPTLFWTPERVTFYVEVDLPREVTSRLLTDPRIHDAQVQGGGLWATGATREEVSLAVLGALRDTGAKARLMQERDMGGTR